MKLLFKRSTRTRIRFYTVRSLSRCYAYVSGECIMKQYAKYGGSEKQKKGIHSSFSGGRPCHRDGELQSAKLCLRINLPPGEKF